MNVKELDTVKKNIAAKIKELRGGLDQQTFAEKCQTSQPCISRWEKGGGIPSTESLVDIARACKISVADIIEAAANGLPTWKAEPKAAPVKAAPKKPTVKKAAPKSKVEKKAAKRAAALDAPDKPKRSHTKKDMNVGPAPAPVILATDTGKALPPISETVEATENKMLDDAVARGDK